MKHEFIPFDNSQDRDQPQPEQAPGPLEWPRPSMNMNTQPNVPNQTPAQPQEGQEGPRHPANWKPGQNPQGQQGQQPNPASNIAASSMPVQPQGPVIGSGYNQQNGPPFHQRRQPMNGPTAQSAQPFNSAAKPFVVGPPRQPYQVPGSQPMPRQANQPNQQNQSFGSQPMPGQPQNPWQQRQIAPMGPTNPAVPPGMIGAGGNGQGGQNGQSVRQNGKGGKKQSPRKKRRFPIWARIVVGVLAFLLILTAGGFIYYQVNFAGIVANDTGQVGKRLENDVNPNQNQNPGSSILSGGRINVLLLGSDDDYKSRVINGGVLAQTDIVVSIDPATHSVTMFSIPRDTWLNVPGFGMHKLDQAYLLGGGGANGAALTMGTIHQDFGVYIDHYAWVGLSGFTKVIDTVGGIDINVIHPIVDDAYPDDTGKGATDPYAVKRLLIAPGPQHLNGLTALEYVRSRHADLVGDIGRSVRQQQILNQLKYKLDNPGIVGQLPTLANDLNGTVKTDMSIQQVLDLVNFARSVDQSKIQKITLGAPYSSTATVAGQDVILLNCSLVQPLIAQTFKVGNNAKCDLQANSNSSSVTSVTSPPPTANTTAQASSSSIWQIISDMAQTNFMSFDGNWSNLFGIHSLLDIMFLATFESPAALLI